MDDISRYPDHGTIHPHRHILLTISAIGVALTALIICSAWIVDSTGPSFQTFWLTTSFVGVYVAIYYLWRGSPKTFQFYLAHMLLLIAIYDVTNNKETILVEATVVFTLSFLVSSRLTLFVLEYYFLALTLHSLMQAQPPDLDIIFASIILILGVVALFYAPFVYSQLCMRLNNAMGITPSNTSIHELQNDPARSSPSVPGSKSRLHWRPVCKTLLRCLTAS
jgi:hypothetical protein